MGMEMRDIMRIMEAYRAFHGTSRNFRAFKVPTPRDGHYRLGLYFTASLQHASAYSKFRDGPKPRIIEVSLTINNPFDIHDLTDQEVIDLLPLPVEPKRELRSAFRGHAGEQYGLLEAGVRFGLREALKAAGYDGVLYREGPSMSYIVFSSDQVQIVRSTVN